MEEKDILQLDQETVDKMLDDSHRYIFNLLGFEGEYSDEKFKEEMDKLKPEEIFTVAKPLDMETDLLTLTQGYGNFGKLFIKNIIDKDKDSAYHVFESVVQDWLDLKEFISSFTKRIEEETLKLKEMRESSDKKSE